MREARRAFLLLWIAATLSLVAHAQQACQAPALAGSAALAPNIFSPEMESALGDIMANRLNGRFRLTRNRAITAYLSAVAARLSKGLPPNQVKFRFYLIDLPIPEAFEIPGGRIYISPMLIMLTRDEDELASILAHEMGHLATHQNAIDMTMALGKVLGVSEIKDRKDLDQDWIRLLENWRTHPEVARQISKENAEHQVEADQVGLYLVARAGYSPQSFLDVFNRTAETRSKTGDWLTDFLHRTTPDMRRLRLQVQTLHALPPECIEHHEADLASFRKWQAQVATYSDWDNEEVLPGLVSKVKLNPPIRPEVRQIRFSPDGKHILVQDASNISILTRQPLALLFQIPVEDADQASFTPDSDAVVFNTASLRVEKWSLSQCKRLSVTRLTVPRGCAERMLAPDGQTLACLMPGSELRLLDVASGQTIFEKQHAGALEFFIGPFNSAPTLHMEFSPDGKAFLAGGIKAIAFNVAERSPMALNRLNLGGWFAFLDSQRVAVREVSHSEYTAPYSLGGISIREPPEAKVTIRDFPDGKKLDSYNLGFHTFYAPSQGDYLIVSNPDNKHAAGVFDLRTRRFVTADSSPYLDIYGNTIVHQNPDGEIGLFEVHGLKPIGSLKLPGGSLGFVTASAVSQDLKWVALSEQKRGGVWNLATGKQIYEVRGFDGAWIDRDVAVYADFPKFEGAPRQILGLSLLSNITAPAFQVKDAFAVQRGRYLLVLKPKHPGAYLSSWTSEVTFEIRDAHTGQTVWSRQFAKRPPVAFIDSGAQTAVFLWQAASSEAEEEARLFAPVARDLATDLDRKDDYFLEAVDIRSGSPLGALTVKTGDGSFRIVRASAEEGRWFLENSVGEVMVYSMASRKQLGEVTGTNPVVSKLTSLLAVRDRMKELEIYSLDSFARLDHLYFSRPVVLYRFSPDGNRLMALTSDQYAYVFDLTDIAPNSQQAVR